MIKYWLIYIVICVVIGMLGDHRKWGFWGYFFASLFFSPFFGVLLVMASDPRKEV